MAFRSSAVSWKVNRQGGGGQRPRWRTGAEGRHPQENGQRGEAAGDLWDREPEAWPSCFPRCRRERPWRCEAPWLVVRGWRPRARCASAWRPRASAAWRPPLCREPRSRTTPVRAPPPQRALVRLHLHKRMPGAVAVFKVQTFSLCWTHNTGVFLPESFVTSAAK